MFMRWSRSSQIVGLMRFVHETLAQRVRFATGSARGQLTDEIEQSAFRRPMVISTRGQREVAEEVCGDVSVGVWHHDVAMHVPIHLAERARSVAGNERVDSVIAVGGGSTVGLAKAVALTTSLPIVAIPTTYAGSEATNVWGITENGQKMTGSDARVLPQAVILDAELTVSLPVDLAMASGLNALAHCIDSMWAPRADPINASLALEGMRALRAGLPQVKADPSSLQGHEETLFGAYLAAVAFASAGSGLHHKICHVLGGMFDLPHAQTHAVVLPHVLALNGAAAPTVQARIGQALGSTSADEGLAELRRALQAPSALRDLGMPESGIVRAAQTLESLIPPSNPATLSGDELRALLRACWEGIGQS